MIAPSSPDKMTPTQRLREIAAILARGVLRLRKRRYQPAVSSREAPKIGFQGLEFPHEMRLSVPRVNDFESRRRSRVVAGR